MMQREQWHVAEGLVLVHFAVFLLTSTSPESAGALALIPQLLAERPWTLLTFQFVHAGGMIWFFFSMLVLWIMARPLEESWGSPRFVLFWLVSVLGAAGTAVVFGQPLAGNIFLATSLLFTFATLWPETQFYLFFILPVKVKWLAVVGGVILVYSSFGNLGPIGGLANAVGMSTGYVFFLITRRLPSRRKIALKVRQQQSMAVGAAKGALQQRQNEALDARVREAEERARRGAATEADEGLLAELDAAVDPSVTVCAPGDFGYVEDPVCRGCAGYAECAARRIRMARQEGEAARPQEDGDGAGA